MPKARPLTKESIISAMDKTKSVRAAARYLNCSYQHIKKWMKLYVYSNGVSLFHKYPIWGIGNKINIFKLLVYFKEVESSNHIKRGKIRKALTIGI